MYVITEAESLGGTGNGNWGLGTGGMSSSGGGQRDRWGTLGTAGEQWESVGTVGEQRGQLMRIAPFPALQDSRIANTFSSPEPTTWGRSLLVELRNR